MFAMEFENDLDPREDNVCLTKLLFILEFY